MDVTLLKYVILMTIFVVKMEVVYSKDEVESSGLESYLEFLHKQLVMCQEEKKDVDNAIEQLTLDIDALEAKTVKSVDTAEFKGKLGATPSLLKEQEKKISDQEKELLTLKKQLLIEQETKNALREQCLVLKRIESKYGQLLPVHEKLVKEKEVVDLDLKLLRSQWNSLQASTQEIIFQNSLVSNEQIDKIKKLEDEISYRQDIEQKLTQQLQEVQQQALDLHNAYDVLAEQKQIVEANLEIATRLQEETVQQCNCLQELQKKLDADNAHLSEINQNQLSTITHLHGAENKQKEKTFGLENIGALLPITVAFLLDQNIALATKLNLVGMAAIVKFGRPIYKKLTKVATLMMRLR